MLAFKVGRLENERRLSLFNECLIKENYGELSSYIWEIPYELQIAVCAMLEIEYDIDGERINDLMSSEPLKSVYLNIFPETVFLIAFGLGMKKTQCMKALQRVSLG